MRVLITGSNGFLAKSLAYKLGARGIDLVGIGRDNANLNSSIRNYICGDVGDPRFINKIVDTVDAVIHLAAVTEHNKIVSYANETFIAAINTSIVLSEAIRKSNRCNRLIFSSSGKVYGRYDSLPLSEEMPTRPTNELGKMKLAIEDVFNFYNGDLKKFINLRIFNVFGEGQKKTFLLPTILNQIIKKEVTKITLGDIHSKRDYVYSEDVADAFISLTLAKSINEKLNTYNVSSGTSLSAEEIVRKISILTSKKIQINIDDTRLRKNENLEESGSYKLINDNFNWSPKMSLFTWLMKYTISPRGE